VGSDPNSPLRYYYVYNGHGDVVALVDASGNSVASYSYDAFGQLTAASENFGGTTTWTNPYRYDGRDGVRSDGETGLYWMSVRAYDPALGRFLSRDPLGRVPLFFSDQPYVYGGNNPLSNVDPSGQFMADIAPAQAHAMMKKYALKFRMTHYHPTICDKRCQYKNNKIAGLRDAADNWHIVAAALGLIADISRAVLHIKAGKWLKAILDSLGILASVSDLFEAIAKKLKGDWIHISAQVSALIQKGLGILNFVRGILDTPFVGGLIQYTLLGLVNYVFPGLSGPLGIGVQVIAGTLGEAGLDFMSAGAHWAQGQQKSLEDEANQDGLMPIDAFCKMDRGCPSR
jgi:RHS repeat-associated protein